MTVPNGQIKANTNVKKNIKTNEELNKHFRDDNEDSSYLRRTGWKTQNREGLSKCSDIEVQSDIHFTGIAKLFPI